MRHRQHEVGRRHAFIEPARETEADDFRDQHRKRLTEHRGLGFDAADAPTEHGKAVDHCRVTVGSDERIGVGELRAVGRRAGPNRLRQILEIDLMTDAGSRRNDPEILEGALAPFQEIIALAVARVFVRDVIRQGFRRTEFIDDDRVVDDEVHGHQRIDLRRIAAELGHAVAHCSEIDDGRHAGEILHQHASRPEADLLFGFAFVVEPTGHRGDIGLGDRTPVLVAQ